MTLLLCTQIAYTQPTKEQAQKQVIDLQDRQIILLEQRSKLDSANYARKELGWSKALDSCNYRTATVLVENDDLKQQVRQLKGKRRFSKVFHTARDTLALIGVALIAVIILK